MATDAKPKPLPDPKDLDNGPFWSGTEQGKLTVKHCGACGRHHWPPRLGCPHCGSDQVTWVTVAPKGEVYSGSWSTAARRRASRAKCPMRWTTTHE